MTYPQKEKLVDAQYGDSGGGNPFLAALPDMLPREEFLAEMKSSPRLPIDLPAMTVEQRSRVIPMIASAFFPMDYMYASARRS